MSADDRREQLLDVAASLTAERGFSAISIQSVAGAARISRPVVYEHFSNIGVLLEAVIERETSRALQQASDTTLTDLTRGDPATLMLASLRRYLQTVESNPRTWRLVLMAPEGAPALLRDSIRSGRQRILGQLTSAVVPLELSPEAPFDPELTARILSALADEYARLLLSDPARYPLERLTAHARVIVEQLG